MIDYVDYCDHFCESWPKKTQPDTQGPNQLSEFGGEHEFSRISGILQFLRFHPGSCHRQSKCRYRHAIR